MLPGVTWCENALDALKGADVLLVLTEWNEFRALDLKAAKAAMKGDLLVDLRNIYRPEDMAERGFEYTSVGR